MPSSCACSGERGATDCPSSSMLPASGACTPVRILISVDLPAPFWPMSACTSPARSVSCTSASACTPGKAREMSRAWSTIGASLMGSNRPRSVLARLDVLLRRFHGEDLLVDHDALRNRLARVHLDHRGHELRSEQGIALDGGVELAGDHGFECALHRVDGYDGDLAARLLAGFFDRLDRADGHVVVVR